jgi:hypothetical protein
MDQQAFCAEHAQKRNFDPEIVEPVTRQRNSDQK